jgi:hypothetical protein
MNINKIFLTFRIDKEEGLFGRSPNFMKLNKFDKNI